MQFVFITAEGDGVFKVHLFTRLRQLIRRPVSDDVIVGFIVGWNFHQLNAAFAPLSESPMRLTKIVTIIEIFKAGEITTTLQ